MTNSKHVKTWFPRFLLSILCATATPVHSQEDPNDVKKERDVKILPIPLVSYDNSFGFSYGAMVAGFYPLSKSDTISPPSQTGIAVKFTTNGSLFGIGFTRHFLKEDLYRIVAAGGFGVSNFQTYVDVIPGGFFIPFSTRFELGYLNLQRQIIKNVYLGPSLLLARAKTVFYLAPLPPDLTTDEGIYNALGINLAFDSRDNIFNARDGWLIEVSFLHYADWLGSQKIYTKYNVTINKYHSFDDRKALAIRATSEFGSGNVPFQAQSVVGGDDLRGYTDGKHRANQVATTQAEWRHFFTERFGMVAFAGVAFSGSDIVNLGPMLPAGGTGIRFKAIESYDINIGFDIAAGREDWGIYFRIGEAF